MSNGYDEGFDDRESGREYRELEMLDRDGYWISMFIDHESGLVVGDRQTFEGWVSR